MTNVTQITVSTRITANLARVWDALTRPEAITRWNFAIPEWHCPAASNDLRVGGRFSYRMEARDGSMGFDFGGQFTSVVPLQELAFVLGDGRKTSIQLRQVGPEVEIVEMFDAEGTNPVELQQRGWQAILDNLRKYVESSA